MVTIYRGIIKSYTSGTHRASVQIAGSLAVWLDSVPVATNVPPSQVVADRECGVLFFTEDNQDDAVVICVHGVVPAASPFRRIQDADNDTYVDVENSADEDIVRIAVAGTERLAIQNSSWHGSFLGDLSTYGKFHAGGNPAGAGDGLTTDYGHAIGQSGGSASTMLTVSLSAAAAGGRSGISLAPSWNPTADGITFRALTGNCQVGLTSGALADRTGISGYGLDYSITYYNLSSTRALTFTDCAGIRVAPAMTLATSALNIPVLTGVRVAPTGNYGLANLNLTIFRSFHANFAGGASVVTNVGLDIDALTAGTNRYGIRVGDMTGGTVARILELGPSTPYLRLEGSGNWTPTANQTALLLAEGATPTLRRVQWKAGNALGVNDKVLVLV